MEAEARGRARVGVELREEQHLVLHHMRVVEPAVACDGVARQAVLLRVRLGRERHVDADVVVRRDDRLLVAARERVVVDGVLVGDVAPRVEEHVLALLRVRPPVRARHRAVVRLLVELLDALLRAEVRVHDVRVAVDAVAAAGERVVVPALVGLAGVAHDVVEDDDALGARLALDEFLHLAVVVALHPLGIVKIAVGQPRGPRHERKPLLGERNRARLLRRPPIVDDDVDGKGLARHAARQLFRVAQHAERVEA